MPAGFKNSRKLWTNGQDPNIPVRLLNLENNEYKITYYEIISGASGSLTLPAGATINAGEFGLSGNCILSKIDGSNKPTFESPKTSGGVVVTASLDETDGSWIASGTYTDSSVALIYSIKIKAIYYSNLDYDFIIETVELTDFPISQTITNGITNKAPSEDAVYDALTGYMPQNAWTNVFGSCTITGFASFTTSEVFVKDLGDTYAIQGLLQGTYSGTAVTVQLPFSVGANVGDLVYGLNNGTGVTCRMNIPANDTITFYSSAAGGSWTAAGVRAVSFDFIVKKP